ncbi:CotH kinase family protein [Larkinella soli]|uniref:CotH kinase family protein n=1 Tax=Larkinella soli TaxID=1770527 RepID=UPI000FFB6F51|nr:CotH kinase family protein [Larkinella soli]
MKKFNSLQTLVLSLILLLTGYRTLAETVVAEPGTFEIDAGLKVIVCNRIPTLTTGGKNVIITFDKDYTFTTQVTALETGKLYTVSNNGAQFKLYFTSFPLIHIKTNGNTPVSEDENVLTRGSVSIGDPAGAPFTSPMGVRIRGNISRSFPKKSYKIELSEDEAGEEARDAALLGFREDSEWLLLAMYNEPLRINNATSHALWLKTHTLYYQSKEPEAIPGIRTRYVDVFVNNSYMGVYAFTEQVDRKQLKLKKTGDNGEVRGELYKAGAIVPGTTFTKPTPTYNPNAGEVWAGYEIKLPKDPYYWRNLSDLINYLVNSKVLDFKANVSGKLQLDNLIDYFLFLNVIRATDNTGNNQYLARYKEGEPYIFIPWDLDGTLGYWPQGKKNVYRDIITNGLLDRLLAIDPENYKIRMKKRWFALRQTVFSTESLLADMSANYNLLTAEGAYLREALKWSGSITPNDFGYMKTWMTNRVTYLDQYFSAFPDEGNPLVSGNFEGYMDGGNCNTLWGWVWDKNQPNFSVAVEVLDGNTVVDAYMADILRQDLQSAGKGNGVHGFSFPFPENLKDNQPHNLSLRILGTNYVVRNSAKSLTCAGSVPPGNRAPVPPAATPLSATINQPFQATLPPFTDPDNDPLTYSLAGTLPSGLDFDPGSRVLSGTPTQTGTYSLTYAAGDGKASGSVVLSLTVGNGETPPPGPVTGNFEGYLDGADCNSFRGWIWDRNKPNLSLPIEILDGNTVVGTATASNFRQDLKDKGKGNGMHGYVFLTPPALKDGNPHAISVRVTGSSFILKGSPKSITCAPAGRLSAGDTDPDSDHWLVWPNPTAGSFELSYVGREGVRSVLRVVDAAGRVQLEKPLPGLGRQKTRVNLSVASGSYRVLLQQGDTVRSRPIVVAR